MSVAVTIPPEIVHLLTSEDGELVITRINGEFIFQLIVGEAHGRDIYETEDTSLQAGLYDIAKVIGDE